MTTAYPSPEHLAPGKLAIAQQRMVQTYPFHARFVAAWHVQAAPAVRTMAVTIQGGAISLLFNPAFVVDCTLPELLGVLHHEVNHLLFGHLFLDPAQFPDQEALLIAEEITANEWVPEPLPGTPLRLAQFPALPPNEDTVTRYQRLATDCQGGQEAAKTGCQDPKIGHRGHNSVPDGSESGPSTSLAGSCESLDDHTVWDTARRAGRLGELTVRVLVRDTTAQLTHGEWQSLPTAMQQRLATLCRGETAGTSVEQLRRTGAGQLNWRHILRRYVREATEVRPVFTRPSRRFPTLLGIVPGSLRQLTQPRVMAVIDTSGSITTALLAQIAAELAHLAIHHRVTVVECDAVIHAITPYRGHLPHVHGRGGTDLRPPFAPVVLRQIRPDVVVYFTDGAGPAPATPPSVPVVWCLTPHGQPPTRWGRVLCLREGS